MSDDIRAKAKAAADAAAAAATPGGSVQDINVMVGRPQPMQGPFAGELQGKPRPTVSSTIPASQLQESVLAMAANRDPAYNDLADLLIAGDFLRKDYKKYPRYTSNSLGEAITLHAAYVKGGGDKPFAEWLQWYADTQEPSEESRRRGAYRGPVTTTTTTITDEVTAEALLDRVSRDLLGRALTKQETSKYLREFRQAEEGAPQVTVSTPRGQAAQDVRTVTAADKGEMLRQIIVQNPDYQKYQVDTTIMDMLLGDIEKGREVIYG